MTFKRWIKSVLITGLCFIAMSTMAQTGKDADKMAVSAAQLVEAQKARSVFFKNDSEAVNVVLTNAQALDVSLNLANGMAAEDILVNVSINYFDDNQNYVSSEGQDVTISQGSNSGQVTLNVVPPASGFFEVSYFCQQNCGSLVSSAYYTLNGTQGFSGAARFAIIDLPSMVDLTLSEGLVISGNISLPSGHSAGIVNGHLDVSYTNGGSEPIRFFNQFTIENQEQSASYTVTVPTTPEGTTYLLDYGCDSNCGTLVNNTTVDITNDLLGEQPAVLDLVLVNGQALDVSLNLANGMAAEDILVNVSINYFNDNQNYVSSEGQDVTISQGSSSGHVTLNVVPPASGFFEVSYFCQQNCGSLVSSAYYTLNGTQGFSDAARFAIADLPSTVGLTLNEGLTVSGNVRLPTGHPDGSVNGNLSVFLMYPNGERFDFFGQYSIADQERSTPYSTTLPIAPEGTTYTIEYGCNTNCGNLIGYTALDITSEILNRQPAVVDLVLVSGQALDVSLDLASGVAAEDILLYGSVNYFDENQNYMSSEGAQATIAQGESGVQFTALISPPENGFFEISYHCQQNCGSLVSSAYYTLNGTQGFSDAARFAIADLPSTVGLTLNEGLTVSGNVRLPTTYAGGPLRGSLNVFLTQPNGERFGFFNEYSMSAQERSTPYSMTVPVGVDGAIYTIEYGCNINCGNLVANTTVNITSEILSQQPAVVDLVLVSGQALGVSLNLTSGVAAEDIQLSVSVNYFNENQDYVSSERQDVTISQGAASGDVVLNIAPPTSGFFEVNYHCQQNCGALVTSGYYTPNGTQGFSDAVRIPVAGLPSMVDLTLDEGLIISGDISLPSGHSGGAISGHLDVSYTDGSSESIRFFNQFTIRNQEQSVAYSVTVPTTPDGTSYVIDYGCDTNCGLLVNNTTRDITDEINGSQAVVVDLVLVLNRQINEDAFESDDTVEMAKVIQPGDIQNRTIHQAGDVDWVLFSIEEGDADITLETRVADTSDGALIISVYNTSQTLVAQFDGNITASGGISRLILDELPAGDYSLLIEAMSGTTRVSAYTLTLTLDRIEEELCFPIPTNNGRMAIICI